MRNLGLVVLGACVISLSAPGDGAHDKLVIRLKAFTAAGGPGVAVGIARGDSELFAGGFGLRDLERGTAIDRHTAFELASVSKQITAVAVVVITEEGTLDYADAVTRWLPELKAFSGVTIRHLLHHLGGLPGYEAALCGRGRPVTNADIIRWLVSVHKPVFAPGERYEYSNTGYAVLAAVLERASGKPYPELLRSRIFLPAGMRDTFVNTESLPSGTNLALSYGIWPYFTPMTQPEIVDCNTVYGDGSIYSTVSDLLRWHRALDNPPFAKAESLAVVFETGVLNSGEPTSYGFGWRLGKSCGRKAHLHSGSWGGFRNLTIRFPEDGTRFVFLSNSASTPMESLVDAAAEFAWDAVSLRE